MIPTYANELDSRSRLSWAIRRADYQRKDLELHEKTMAAWLEKRTEAQAILSQGPTLANLERFVTAKLTIDVVDGQIERLKQQVNKSRYTASQYDGFVEQGWRELAEADETIKTMTPALTALRNTGDALSIGRVQGQVMDAQRKIDYWLGLVDQL